ETRCRRKRSRPWNAQGDQAHHRRGGAARLHVDRDGGRPTAQPVRLRPHVVAGAVPGKAPRQDARASRDCVIAVPRHIERSRVAWIDTDAGGRIHFTAAFRWAEAAETALMRSLALMGNWADYPRRAV